MEPDHKLAGRDTQIVGVARMEMNSAQDVRFGPDKIPLNRLRPEPPIRAENLCKRAAMVTVSFQGMNEDALWKRTTQNGVSK